MVPGHRLVQGERLSTACTFPNMQALRQLAARMCYKYLALARRRLHHGTFTKSCTTGNPGMVLCNGYVGIADARLLVTRCLPASC